MKFPIICFARIHQLESQPDVLPLLNEAPYQSSYDPNEDVNITKTDWYNGKDGDRPWVQYFLPHLTDHLHKHLHPFSDFLIQDIWFQQYSNGSEHGWHTHSHNFTGVYYVQLPPDSQTQIIDPFTKERKNLPIKQGDVVVFPSTVIHRAPPSNDKTIISFNFDAFYHFKKE